MRFGRAAFLCLVAAATFLTCTIDVGPNDPPVNVNVEVKCVVVNLPGGGTLAECPETGADAKDAR